MFGKAGTVWASRSGQKWKPANGYSHCVGFWTLDNLVSNIKGEGLSSVTRLAVLAHGDSAGLIQLDKNLTYGSLSTFAQPLKKLSGLMPYGKLIFFSCLSGLGWQGDRLLCAISTHLRNVQVIGFTVKGWGPGTVGGAALRAGDFAATPAGSIYDAGHLGQTDPSAYKGKPFLNEYSPNAKVAVNGWIVRAPRREILNRQLGKDANKKALNPSKLCGSVSCKGHKKIGHVCHPYRRAAATAAQL